MLLNRPWRPKFEWHTLAGKWSVWVLGQKTCVLSSWWIGAITGHTPCSSIASAWTAETNASSGKEWIGPVVAIVTFDGMTFRKAYGTKASHLALVFRAQNCVSCVFCRAVHTCFVYYREIISREEKKVLEWRLVYCFRIKSMIGRFCCYHGIDVTWLFFSSSLWFKKLGRLSASVADPVYLARQKAFSKKKIIYP